MVSSKCKKCGELLRAGNYTLRIIPAKRIPKKARKLSQASKGSLGEPYQQETWAATSFQKFLRKRMSPANIMELTCGKCGESSRIKMLKHQDKGEDSRTDLEKVGESIGEDGATLSKVKRKKSKKDKTAGLTLTLGVSDRTTTSASAKASASVGHNVNNKKTVVSAFRKQKEMENLKKVLFESKKAKKSGSSLQDLLSGI